MADTSKAQAAELHRMDRPFAGLMDRLGISQETVDGVARSEGEEYMPHDEFERQRGWEHPSECAGMLRIEDQSGLLWPVVCDACGFEVGIKVQELEPERLLEARLAKAGIPEEFAGKDFEKDVPEQADALQPCRLWLRQFKQHRLVDSIPAIALYGKAGRGKTHLLSLIIESLVRRDGVDAMYRSAAQLFDELRAGIDTGAYEIRWQRVLRVSVLALDDVGAGRWTEWQQDRFAALVDHRYSHGLPLLVATNIPPQGWESKFGDRTSSRLKGMCVRFELGGADRRVARQESLLGAP